MELSRELLGQSLVCIMALPDENVGESTEFTREPWDKVVLH
jgi:hypothetical protein